MIWISREEARERFASCKTVRRERTLALYANGVPSMIFIEAPAFTRYVAEYLDDDQYRELQTRLALNPELGDLMPGTGGFRKLRWADRRRGKGQRGGLRVIYYYFSSDQQIWLMTLYDKNEAADLTPGQKKALKAAIEGELVARRAGKGEQRRKSGRTQ